MNCVLVEDVGVGNISVWVPKMDYCDSINDEDLDGALWIGPIEVPAAPDDLPQP